jgi:hypothetical protein
MQLEMNEKIQDLRIAFSKLELDLQKLKLAQGKIVFLEKLRAIDEEYCRSFECSPEQCHESELSFYQAIEIIKLREVDYKIGILEIERSAKYNLPTFDFVR